MATGQADGDLRDEWHGGRRAPPCRGRGAPRTGSAHRLHGGPATRAAPRRGALRRSSRRACSRARCGGPTRPACRPRASRPPGGPWPSRRIVESIHGSGGAGSRPPQPRVPRASDGRGGGPSRASGSPSVRPRTEQAVSGLSEPLRGRGIIVVGGQAPEPPDPARACWRWRSGSAGRSWPIRAPESRTVGTIAAADSIVRTHPLLPECVVVLGAPWLSRALGEYISDAADAGARVVVVDPWRQWSDPLRVATEFHFCRVDPWLTAAFEQASPCDPEWLGSWRLWEERAQGCHCRACSGRN